MFLANIRVVNDLRHDLLLLRYPIIVTLLAQHVDVKQKIANFADWWKIRIYHNRQSALRAFSADYMGFSSCTTGLTFLHWPVYRIFVTIFDKSLIFESLQQCPATLYRATDRLHRLNVSLHCHGVSLQRQDVGLQCLSASFQWHDVSLQFHDVSWHRYNESLLCRHADLHYPIVNHHQTIGIVLFSYLQLHS